MSFLDNIKSRIKGEHKDHDHGPGELPDTAQDMYGDVSDVSTGDHIEKVEKPPEPGAPDDLPEISFGGGKKKEVITKDTIPALPEQPKDEIMVIRDDPSPKEEMQQFEDAVSNMYPGEQEEVHEEVKEDVSDTEQTKLTETKHPDYGFFSEFHRFVDKNDIPSVADELVAKDLLDKMKQYHMSKEEGKPYYFHSDELKKELHEKLEDLRNLEKDWFTHRELLFREEAIVLDKEKEISEKAESLKNLMKQIKVKEEFRKETSPHHYFHVGNGQVLKSLSDLNTALRVMEDKVFYHHVGKKKNDFANWVKAVFNNAILAEIIRACKSREEMIRVLDGAEQS